MRRFDPAKLIQALRDDKKDDVPEGWLRTRDIVPLLGLKTLAGVRLPIERMQKAGFIEFRRLTSVRHIYRLSPKFKTWQEAAAEANELEKPVVPHGWITLSTYARKNRRTVRGIQYRIDDAGLPFKTYRIPRPVKHYRKTDLDRILS